jgi:hypothetical protein
MHMGWLVVVGEDAQTMRPVNYDHEG